MFQKENVVDADERKRLMYKWERVKKEATARMLMEIVLDIQEWWMDYPNDPTHPLIERMRVRLNDYYKRNHGKIPMNNLPPPRNYYKTINSERRMKTWSHLKLPCRVGKKPGKPMSWKQCGETVSD